MKSEFKSPTPSDGALNFARQGAEEVSCFVRILRHLGAGAPALSATANSCTSLHVHVNVCNAAAGGDELSCEQILAVFFAWVRFDLVTARLARPWMWREPSMAPLYATGSEFCWREKAWEQGEGVASDVQHDTYDVPRFLAAVRAAYAEEGFAALPEREKRERLFGREATTPASRIGRYCALNLRRLTTYGTLEVRRFHASLDDAVVVRWAHFCAAFVEAFRSSDGGRRLLETARIEDALASMATEQERASPEQLMREMDGYVDGGTAAWFMRDSGAL